MARIEPAWIAACRKGINRLVRTSSVSQTTHSYLDVLFTERERAQVTLELVRILRDMSRI
jgi:hypothetical protein